MTIRKKYKLHGILSQNEFHAVFKGSYFKNNTTWSNARSPQTVHTINNSANAKASRARETSTTPYGCPR